MNIRTESEPTDLTREFLLFPERFVSVKDSAFMLRMHPATARWLARRGDLKSIRTGRSVWIYKPSIGGYLRNLNS
jgi:hypothetical protein